MNILQHTRSIGKNLLQLPGWHTNRKIVVIESDDWGSIRMPSKEIYNYCLKKGYHVDKSPYTKFDSLASEEDIEKLFDVLLSYKDKNGKHPVITANVLVANPDFEKIKSSGLSQYYTESIFDTFSNYPSHKKCLEYWITGHKAGYFFLQSHGREHLNVSRFMNDLKYGNENALFALETKMPGIFPKQSQQGGNFYVSANEYKDTSDRKEKCNIVSSGLILFQKLFNFKSTSFISSNYVWHSDFEVAMYNQGVKYIQGSIFQLIPKGHFKGIKRKFHYLGQQNILGQYYLIRNAFFEPSLNNTTDWINRCLNEINTAFKNNRPAIISMHRINFVGFINSKNRDNNLTMFSLLLSEIIKKWPDIEFMNSVDLGNIISNYKNENCYS